MITHDLGVVADMADKVMVMYAGAIVETGTADEIFYQPAPPLHLGPPATPSPSRDARREAPAHAHRGQPAVDLMSLPDRLLLRARGARYATDRSAAPAEPRAHRRVTPGHFARCHYAADEAFVAAKRPRARAPRREGRR